MRKNSGMGMGDGRRGSYRRKARGRKKSRKRTLMGRGSGAGEPRGGSPGQEPDTE